MQLIGYYDFINRIAFKTFMSLKCIPKESRTQTFLKKFPK